MKQINLPKYSTMLALLEETGLKIHPSQLHGLISGALVGSKDPLDVAGLQALVSGDLNFDQIKTHFIAICETTQQQLKDFLFEFELLLPEDDESLSSRAEGLTVWCQGFLTGLKLVGVAVDVLDDQVDEVKEAINDMLEISKMDYEQVVASEEDEEAYVELVEYVRMAVILMYQEWHEVASDQNPKETSNHLH